MKGFICDSCHVNPVSHPRNRRCSECHQKAYAIDCARKAKRAAEHRAERKERMLSQAVATTAAMPSQHKEGAA